MSAFGLWHPSQGGRKGCQERMAGSVRGALAARVWSGKSCTEAKKVQPSRRLNLSSTARSGLALVPLLFAVAACEPEAEKLERLQLEAALTRAEVVGHRGTLERYSGQMTGAQRDSVNALLRAAETKATLAQRELDLFLHGD